MEELPGRLEARGSALRADPMRTLYETIIGLDDALCSHPDLSSVCDSAGTTATVVYMKGLKLHVACLGDSRAVLGSMEDGHVVAIDLTSDHKPDAPKEKERILQAGGTITPANKQGGARVWAAAQHGLLVSRSLGDRLHKVRGNGVVAEAEMHSLELKLPPVGSSGKLHATADGDRFLILASDGLWEQVSSQHAVNVAAKHADNAREASQALVKLAEKRWNALSSGEARDDITVTVAFLPLSAQVEEDRGDVRTYV